jgi:hypothetical protein
MAPQILSAIRVSLRRCRVGTCTIRRFHPGPIEATEIGYDECDGGHREFDPMQRSMGFGRDGLPMEQVPTQKGGKDDEMYFVLKDVYR